MSHPLTGDLDVILKSLIDDPQQFDNVKRTLEGRIEQTKPAKPAYARFAEDDDDRFDNMPV